MRSPARRSRSRQPRSAFSSKPNRAEHLQAPRAADFLEVRGPSSHEADGGGHMGRRPGPGGRPPVSKVSVIVPAFEAEATLAATLRSVLEQTYRALEVVVVDDGSSDATRSVAERIASQDNRVRVLGQANAGVAAARNRAIDAATGEFVAPIDADDLWHPRKLELQLERFAQVGPRVGLVYNWFRAIDASNRVKVVSASPQVEGMCLHRHLAYNFIANGSTPLIRREALTGLRYNSDLAKADSGGCEDYLLQMQVAREWEFALVPAWLTGYRKAGTTMSSNVGRMIRSHIMVLGLMRDSVGHTAREVVRRRIARLEIEYVRNRLDRGKPAEAAAALAAALSQDALRVPRNLAEEGVAALRERRPAHLARSFASYPPEQPDGPWAFKLARYMAQLKKLDDQMAEGSAP